MVFSHFSLHKKENSNSVSRKTFERNHLIVELLRLSSEVKVPTETMLDWSYSLSFCHFAAVSGFTFALPPFLPNDDDDESQYFMHKKKKRDRFREQTIAKVFFGSRTARRCRSKRARRKSQSDPLPHIHKGRGTYEMSLTLTFPLSHTHILTHIYTHTQALSHHSLFCTHTHKKTSNWLSLCWSSPPK